MHGIYKPGIVFFCIVNCLMNIASGQELNFEQLDARQGLPAMECYNMLQDKEGYIWVFTEYGIVKHNGEKFVSVCKNISVKDQNAYTIFQTKQGDMYFANSFSKIYKVRNDSAFSFKEIEKFTKDFRKPDQIIIKILVDENKDIYFSNYESSYVYKYSQDYVKKINLPSKADTAFILFKKITSGFFPIRHNIRNTRKMIKIGIESYDSLKNITLSFPTVYPRMHIEVGDNCYYVENESSIHKIAMNGIITSREIKGIVKFKIDNKNNLWIATYNGILLLDNNLNTRAHYLQNIIVSDICIDNQNGLWATTIGQGVFHCRDRDETEYNYTALLQSEILFLKKAGSIIYFSTVNGGCYQLKGFKIKKLHQFEKTTYCTSITAYNNDLILSTKQGLFIKNTRTGSIIEIKRSDKESMYTLGAEMIDKNIFIKFGGSSADLIKNEVHISHNEFNSKICSFIRFKEDSYLIGLKQGLVLFNFIKNTMISCHPFFADKFISALEFDMDGNLWIGTRGDGLYCIKKDYKITRFFDVPFFVINDIKFFDRNKLIVSTNLGVFVNTYSNATIIGKWINIVDFEVNEVEIMNERIWIAARNGLYSKNIHELYRENDFPVIIHSIYANSRRILNSDELAHNENNLKFDFDFLNFRQPVKKFYFNLSGPTQLSGIIDGNVLQIQNLKPGTYTLNVYPFHGPVYENHFISKTFTIRPALWQRWWFKLVSILLIIFLTAFSVALYFNQQQKRKYRKTEVNKLLAEYKLTALKAQISPHFISNSLSAIQRLIEGGYVDKANQYLAKFSLLIRYVLKYSDKSVAKLSDEIKVIDLNVELEQLRFSNSFEYIKQIDNHIDPDDIYIPPLITQPFIENAIWHGLLPLKNKRQPRLILKIDLTNTHIVISIIDNGVGRLKSGIKSASTSFGAHESKGSALIIQRIENMNKLYNSSGGSVNYIDLLDADNNPIGTQVNILFPLELLNTLYKHQYEGFNN